MSAIDSYKHECIGIVECPSDYEIVLGNNSQRNIPLYRLNEELLSLEADDPWQVKQGDLLLGGGSGESAAFRISIPEAIFLFTDQNWDAFTNYDEIYQAYWTANQAYVFCNGYLKRGWKPSQEIETWLVEHILAFLLREYPALYSKFYGTIPLDEDGSICRLPTLEEKQVW